MSRRTQILLIAFIIIVLIIFLLYLWTREPDTNTNGGGFFGGGVLPGGGNGGSINTGNGFLGGGGGIVPANTPTGGTLPITEEEKGRLVQLTTEPTIGPTVKNKEERVLYFKLGRGFLFDIAFNGDGGEKQLSNTTIPDIIRASWSYDNSAAVLAANEDEILRYRWLQIASTTVRDGFLGGPVVSASFSPTENRLASLIETGDLFSLRSSSPSGEKIQELASTAIRDFEVMWVAKDLVALKTKTSAFAPTFTEFIPTTKGKQIELLALNETGVDMLWHKDGIHYLASKSDAYGRFENLSYRNRLTGDARILSFRTLPEKCFFSRKEADVMFCAIPKPETFKPESLPDAWWQGNVRFADELWKINIATGEKTLLLEGGGFDMQTLFTSPNENYVFFINKNDLTLWSLRIL